MVQLFPVIASTLEAVENACRDHAKIIYVENRVNIELVEILARQWGYRKAEGKKTHGFLYLNSRIPDDSEWELWDPLGIL